MNVFYYILLTAYCISPCKHLSQPGLGMLLFGKSPLLPSTLISLALLHQLPGGVLLDNPICYDCVVVTTDSELGATDQDLVGSYR